MDRATKVLMSNIHIGRDDLVDNWCPGEYGIGPASCDLSCCGDCEACWAADCDNDEEQKKSEHWDFFKSGWAGMFKKAYSRSFVNMNNELIVHPKRNSYFGLSDVDSDKKLKAKVLEYLTRECIKGGDSRSQRYHINGLNSLLNTDFSREDVNLIYTYLGNGVNRNKTIRFIESGYDLRVLEDGRNGND